MAKTLIIPTSPDELAEMANDPLKMAEVFGNPENRDAFLAQYGIAAMKKDGTLKAQIDEQVQVGLKEFMASDGYKSGPPVPAAASNARVSTGKGAVYNKFAPGVQTEGIFDGTSDFFQAIWPRMKGLRNRNDLEAKLQKLADIQDSFGSNVPADGGFLIPETLRSDIMQVALESAVVRPRAQVIPMDSLRVPIPMIDSTSNVSSVFGGVVCYWTEEGASLTESSASFGRVVLDAKKLTGFASVPNELLADAPAFSAFFDSIFPRAVAWFEDVAFMTGTGVGEPEGFISCPASVQVAKQAGQTSKTIVWENIVAMYSRMLPTSIGNAVWIASIDTFPELATMALSVGTGGSAVWLGNFQNSGAGAPPVSILGRPVYFTEKTPALGSTGDINFVDLSYYLIGDRQIMQAMSSEHYEFQNDKTAFRIIERIDGRPWLQSAITPHNNSSNTLSPFVQLAAR